VTPRRPADERPDHGPARLRDGAGRPACPSRWLILDGVDQTIFQTYTTLSLDHYQGYDKALDIYYLSIAYIATMRNWTNLEAFAVSRFLYFYRLVGWRSSPCSTRALLLVFANTFEYFFIAYEAVG
jgi:hypothetical protein